VPVKDKVRDFGCKEFRRFHTLTKVWRVGQYSFAMYRYDIMYLGHCRKGRIPFGASIDRLVRRF
jgi:hypothetical protein